MISRTLLLAGVASLTLLSAPVFAATDTDTAAAPVADQTTSVGTGASDASDEILVTARRRQETSQEVPLAISVIGGEHIDNTGSFNVGRLTQLTPSLTF
jgi:iron complex outermembrane receptor protein